MPRINMDPNRDFDCVENERNSSTYAAPLTVQTNATSPQNCTMTASKSDSDYGSPDSFTDETHNSVTPLLSRKAAPARTEDNGQPVRPEGNPRPTSLGHPLDLISRQLSTESQQRASFTLRQGSKHLFTVLNYGQTPIDECPSAQLSPTLSVDGKSLASSKDLVAALKAKTSQRNNSNVDSLLEQQICISSPKNKSGDPVLESRICIPTTPTDVPKKVSFDLQCKFEDPSKTDSVTSGSITKSLALVDIIRRGLIFAKRKQKRLVSKSGDINFSNTNVHKKSLSYFLDMFTTLLDLKWRYIVFIFVMAFLATWVIFGLIWWSFVLVAQHGSSNGTDTQTKCFDGVYDFSTALLFSIETQQTIGYGTRSITPECPLAIGFVMLQSLVGVLLSCVMTGLIFAKFSRPKRRAETILFSKSAVICERDGQRCLVFRVGDMRRTHMITVNIRAMLIRQHVTKEGEEMPLYQHNLHVETEAEDFFFLAWPIKIVHKIDEKSPLWKMSSEDLLAADFEVFVLLEGTNQTTGQTTQVRTSYLPAEILWGNRLHSLITSVKTNNKYQVDYTRFHETVPVNMSENSAEFFELKKTHSSRFSTQLI